MTSPIDYDRAKVERLLHDPSVDWPQFLVELDASSKGVHQWARRAAPDLTPLLADKKAKRVVPLTHLQAQACLPLIRQAADLAEPSPSKTITENACGIIAEAMRIVGKPRLPNGSMYAIAHVLLEHGCPPAAAGSLRWHKLQVVNNPTEYGLQF